MNKEPKNVIHRMGSIENTRMLFDFMQALSDRCVEYKNAEKWNYTGYDGSGGLEKRQGLYAGLNADVSELITSCMDNNGNYLSLNPLSDYLHFYRQKLFPKDSTEQITACLQYFNTLRYLDEHADIHDMETTAVHDSLPYYYEDLCFSIREMTGCHSTYIVYSEKGEVGKLVSRSGYIVNVKQKDDFSGFKISQEKLDDIILSTRDCNEEYSNEKIINGIFEVKPKTNANHTFLVFALPLSDLDTQGETRVFHLILDFTLNDSADKFDIYESAALKILFLRHRLITALTNDYTKLLAFRFDCSYVRSLRPCYSENDLPTILHISDSHLQALDPSKYEDMIKDLSLEYVGLKEKYLSIDLIAITGDLVNASNNAADAQENYKAAGEFLQALVMKLWGIKSGEDLILPHDWKRRILIVPGNHDYTSMSDVVVEAESRRIKAAFPSKRSAGTLSKLTYYIEFIAKYLDAPIVELVEHDMNEVRHFRNLNLKVALLNSVANSNSLQNNKVGFSSSKILASLLEKQEWNEDSDKGHRLVLMHHSPKYKINYFDDKYELLKIKGLSDGFADVYKDLLEIFASTTAATDLSAFCSLFTKEFVDVLRNQVQQNGANKHFSKSLLFYDIKMLLDILDKNPSASKLDSEFEFEFFSHIKNTSAIEKQDQTDFNDGCKKILSLPNTTVLAGHEHKTYIDKYESPSGNSIPIFLISKLFRKKSDVCQISVIYSNNNKYQRSVIYVNPAMRHISAQNFSRGQLVKCR